MTSKVWEKQPKESSKAYFSFCNYRDLGPERSVEKTARKQGKKIPKDGGNRTLEAWCTKFNWVSRAAAYDDYIERRKREENEKMIIEMSERHAKLAVAFQQRLAQRLSSLEPSEITPGDMARWLDIATKIERLSRGEPTEIGKQEVQATWADLVKAMREKKDEPRISKSD